MPTIPSRKPGEPANPSVSGGQVFKKFIGYYSKYKFLFWFDLVCATLLACIDRHFPSCSTSSRVTSSSSLHPW